MPSVIHGGDEFTDLLDAPSNTENGGTSHLSVSCGVPQGFVLGQLLFLLYINILPNSSKELSFYLFADDTNI